MKYVYNFPAHRRILEQKIGRKLARQECVDHINGDTMDNRPENLRVATKSLNAANAKKRQNRNGASQYKGVSRAPRGGVTKPWRARIALNYKEMSLGYFATELEAAKAYDKAAIEFFGEFARTNFNESDS